jgi:predicted MFS family arabinose efflux permease
LIHGLVLVRRDTVFGRFWLGGLISRTGDMVTVVALSWLVLSVAGPAELGIALLCFGLPKMFSSPVAGRLLDRYEPRLLLGWDNALRSVLIGLLPLLNFLGVLNIPVVYVIAACCAGLSSVTDVGESTLVPRLVEDRELEAANSLFGANWEIAAIVGPPLSGLLVAWTGAPTALLVDALSFAAMSAICFGLPTLGRFERSAERRRTWLGSGLLFRLPAVLALTATTVGFLFLQGMLEVLLPVLSRGDLAGGPGTYGLLVGAMGTGALLGVVFGRVVYGKLRPHLRMSLVLIGGAPPFAVLAAADNVPVAVVLVVVAMFLWGPYYVFERSLVQRLTPAQRRGEVLGTRAAILALGFPLGSAVGGALLAHVAMEAVIIGVAAAHVVLSLLPSASRTLRQGIEERVAVSGLKGPVARPISRVHDLIRLYSVERAGEDEPAESVNSRQIVRTGTGMFPSAL